MQKRIIVVGLIFVFAGFLGASFVFKFLTKEKPLTVPVVSLPAKQQVPSAKPMQSITQFDKGLQQPAVSNVIATKLDTQAVLQEKKEPAAVENRETAKIEIPTLILNGIFSSKTGGFALINNRIVKEGDSISGVKIIRIYPNKVELDADGQKITLRVK